MLLLLLLPAHAGVDIGSYGRVQASSDLVGGQGDPVNLVTHGTRLEKGPYLEMDVQLDETTQDGARFDVMITPALQGDLFHYDGQWNSDLAVRNLYVQASDWCKAPLIAWAGSRMLRGDDVHLLDFWPLDEVNTVGGGLMWWPGDWRVSVHAGLNRVVGEDWQVQEEDLPLPGGVGTESVLVLDRQRLVTTAKVGRLFEGDDVTFRAQVYGERQELPEGTRIVEDFIEQDLPADNGSVTGVQLSAWGWGPDAYVHLWYRRATGLGAIGDLAVPGVGLATDYTVHAAREHLVALAGNSESKDVGLMWGAYVRRFTDADGIETDFDDRWEGIVALRPGVFPTRHTYLGVELSQQWVRPDGLNPRTGEAATLQVTKVAVLPAIQPRPGDFSRPQVRLQYIFTYMNDDARTMYADQDVRHRSNTQHFLGIGAEWWLNSKSYR